MEMVCSLEVLVLYAKELEELEVATVDVSQQLMAQFKRNLGLNLESNEAEMYFATREYTKHMQPNQIREALMKGYVEMSQINLTICSECLHAEYEAEHMVERLVSGG